ncbi:hypothetical protein GGR34_001726 [Microvirga flocculans]|uniref:Uncharacterized protein n=1 Tax=Microvirga flocculans TaxID=217168 RepID=A0A7W6IFS8_9HYPH|nr:hypothetical protein [Microvirga flocculans]MBB4040075.1 hypothetical protein [Microvirga flocculans]
MRVSEGGFFASFWYGIVLTAVLVVGIGPLIIFFPTPPTPSNETSDIVTLVLWVGLSVLSAISAYFRPLQKRRAVLTLSFIILLISIVTVFTMRVLNQLEVPMPSRYVWKLLFALDGEAAYDADVYEFMLRIWLVVAVLVAAVVRLGQALKARQ